MKKTLLTFSALFLLASPAMAASPYVSANVGLGLPGNSGDSYGNVISYKTSVPFGGAVGLIGDGYRVEAALGHVTNDVDQRNGVSLSGDKISFFSYMANAYYDFDIKGYGFLPYTMWGIGGVSISPNAPDLNISTNKPVFAWQLGAGIGVKAAQNVVFDLGYRYFKPSAYKDNGNNVTFSSSNILLGMRYNF